MIQGVEIKQLRVIPDERGWLMEILRADEPMFKKFGQMYMTVAYPGVVKGWHYHQKQYDHFAVVKGMLKVVLYDGRKDSPTYGEVQEFFMGDRNPIMVSIPPGVVHGMKGMGVEPGFLLNCPTECYNYDKPDEFRIDPHTNDIPYKWALRDF